MYIVLLIQHNSVSSQTWCEASAGAGLTLPSQCKIMLFSNAMYHLRIRSAVRFSQLSTLAMISPDSRPNSEALSRHVKAQTPLSSPRWSSPNVTHTSNIMW